VNTDVSAQATVDAPGGDSRPGLSPGWVMARRHLGGAGPSRLIMVPNSPQCAPRAPGCLHHHMRRTALQVGAGACCVPGNGPYVPWAAGQRLVAGDRGTGVHYAAGAGRATIPADGQDVLLRDGVSRLVTVNKDFELVGTASNLPSCRPWYRRPAGRGPEPGSAAERRTRPANQIPATRHAGRSWLGASGCLPRPGP